MTNNIITEFDTDIQTFIYTEESVIVQSDDTINVFNTVEIGPQGIPGVVGPAGEKGDPGEPLYISAIASEDIGGHRVVLIFNNQATYANNINNYNGQLAITNSATNTGNSLNAYVSGTITESTWNFTTGNVYLSTNGLLTQTFPSVGSVIKIGSAISQTSININFQIMFKRN